MADINEQKSREGHNRSMSNVKDFNAHDGNASKPNNASDLNKDDLVNEIGKSIADMQTRMQDTYAQLGETELIGQSHDGYVKLIMTATYQFKDTQLDRRAFANAQGKFDEKEFTWRLREAWNDLSKKIQEETQKQTLNLLQNMQIPEDIRNLAVEEEEEDK